MVDMKLAHQLVQLRNWQQGRLRQLAKLPSWLKQQDLLTPRAGFVIEQAMEAVRDDRVTIAVVGDCSRGKTELLNALFFADLGSRLLPTHAGRSTLCPTLIHYDPRQPPRLRLLPIETRQDDRSLDTLRRTPASWVDVPLAIDDPDALAAALARLSERKTVDTDTVRALTGEGEAHATEVPRWRFAELNLPHKTLRRGLRILDTPGLDMLAREPALARDLLPTADATLFVVGADAGVTQSDLALWKHFASGPACSRDAALTIVLNKSDTLWGPSGSPHQVAASIIGQCRMAARRLDVNEQQVFAVSAKMALLARCRDDAALEQRSGIGDLELHVGRAIAANRMRLLKNGHIARVREALVAAKEVVDTRLHDDQHLLNTLCHLTERSDAEIMRRLQSTRAGYLEIHRHARRYARTIALFRRCADDLLDTLDPSALALSLVRARAEMLDAWTTRGLRRAMQALEDEIGGHLRVASRQAARLRRLMRLTYRHFGIRLQADIEPPRGLSILHHQVRIGLLLQQARRMRNNPRLAFTSQQQVIALFFDNLVDASRELFAKAHAESARWAGTVMQPLERMLETRSESLRTQVETLQATAASRSTVQQRLDALRRDNARHQEQSSTLDRFHELLEAGGEIDSPVASGQN